MLCVVRSLPAGTVANVVALNARMNFTKKRQKERREREKAKREAGHIPIRSAQDFKRNTTICWTCQNATGGCSWSRALKPVKGWKADKLRVKKNDYTDEVIDGYVVIECPEYIKDS